MLLVLKDVATNFVFVSLENLTRTRGLYACFNRSCSNIEYHLTEASGKTVLLLFIDEYNFFCSSTKTRIILCILFKP